MEEAREELLRRFGRVRDLPYEDKDTLSEWLSEPMDNNHAQYMVNRSNLEILERLQTDGPLGQINLVRTLRTFVSTQRDGQRLLEEAQTKLAEIKAIVGQHVNNTPEGDDRVDVLGIALDILKVLDRPDDPWDGNEDADAATDS